MFPSRTDVSLVILTLGLLVVAAPASAQVGRGPEDKANYPAPEDVAAPPQDAIRTASGLAWRLLGEPADRVDRPGLLDAVDVRYTGWTTDGAVFDTTEVKKQARTFPVGGAIPGFREAVQLLSVGERGRFWVPEQLAYPAGEDKPKGMLVFDVTLVRIHRGPERPANLEAPPATAVRFDSGLAWVVLENGAADQQPPGDEATVLVNYSAWSTTGELLDSTLHRGEPRALTMNMMMEGFRKTFGAMVPGDRRLVWMPPELAEFEGRRPFEETVVFDVEMLSYMDSPEPLENVTVIPDDAVRSPTGLAWRVLKPGTGEVHPREGDTIEVLYSMWTDDGKLFDSSYAHARPGRFALNATMPAGFNEALFAMVSGEKRRVWIPEDLAYAGQKDRPQGMLVFELELLSIEPRNVEETDD